MGPRLESITPSQAGSPAAGEIGRRTLLAGTGAIALVGLLGTLSACSEAEPSTAGPDQVALDAAAAGEQALADLIANAAATNAAITATLEAAAVAHRAHVAALVQAGAAEPASTAPSASPGASPGPAESPSDGASVRTITRDQDRQADALQAAALGVSPRIAQLLGAVAASDAGHAAVIRRAA